MFEIGKIYPEMWKIESIFGCKPLNKNEQLLRRTLVLQQKISIL
jgi:hypothetical protein